MDYTKGRVQPQKTCADLAKLELPAFVRIAAKTIPAAGKVPAHCRVDGMLDPEIVFQVNLPVKWNQ